MTTLLWRETTVQDNGDTREPDRGHRARQLLRFTRDARFESPDPLDCILVPPTAHWSIHESGWPARSFWGWELDEYVRIPPAGARSGGIIRRQWSDPWLDPYRPPIPYLPLWPGLIFNTLFYAATWWGLLALPRLIRRTLRTRRGLCPRCAYDMRGLTKTPCPECGFVCRPCGA